MHKSIPRKPKESSDVRFIALRCIVLELSACENSAEFPAESGCKANDLLSAAERRGTPVLLSALVSDNSGNSPPMSALRMVE